MVNTQLQTIKQIIMIPCSRERFEKFILDHKLKIGRPVMMHGGDYYDSDGKLKASAVDRWAWVEYFVDEPDNNETVKFVSWLMS